MSLRDSIKKRSEVVEQAQLEAARQAQEAAKQAQQERALAEEIKSVRPHPLAGKLTADLRNEYIEAQLILREEGNTLDKGRLLRRFAFSFGITQKIFDERIKTVSAMNDERKEFIVSQMNAKVTSFQITERGKMSGEWYRHDAEGYIHKRIVLCTLFDFVRLHGEEYKLEGDFLDFWHNICVGIFQLPQWEEKKIEELCRQMLQGENEKADTGDKDLDAVADYYLQGGYWANRNAVSENTTSSGGNVDIVLGKNWFADAAAGAISKAMGKKK